MWVNKDVLDLVDPDGSRVHMTAYTDRQIFDLEMRRIFYSSWVYVGHTSEIPQTGDYKTTHLGRVPVILSRDEDGGIHVLVNRCAHRGTTVCQRELGNGSYFKCEYHGWVYNNRGELTGVSLRKGYDDRELGSNLRLPAVPRVEAYQGLIFGSINPDVEPLTDYLGLAKPYIDDWASQSPSGEVSLRAGAWKFAYNGNWKLQVENSTEGYHPDFLHTAAAQVQAHNSNRSRPAGEGVSQTRRPIKTALLNSHGRDLGNGHNLIETPQVSLPMRRKYPPDFISALEQAYGADRVDRLLGPPWRMMIFPNLALAGSNVRMITPVSPNQTHVRQWYVDLPDAPEPVRQFRQAQERGFYGPAGYGGPDDAEMFERMQEGFASAELPFTDPWVRFTRKLHEEEVLASGERVGDVTSEVPQRAVYRMWRRLMAAES